MPNYVCFQALKFPLLSVYSVINYMWLQACYIAVESRLSDLQLSDIPFYPTCRSVTSHSEGLNSIQTAVAYVEQQRQATATDVQLIRSWCELVAKERKEAQMETPCTNSLKK
jgi:hypothetical protein